MESNWGFGDQRAGVDVGQLFQPSAQVTNTLLIRHYRQSANNYNVP